jgi:hypothetical protein
MENEGGEHGINSFRWRWTEVKRSQRLSAAGQVIFHFLP